MKSKNPFKNKHFVSSQDLRGKMSRTSKPLIFVLGIILLLVGGAGIYGYSYYQDWSQNREEVIDYINNNIKIYNSTSNPSKEIVEELNELVEFQTSDREDTRERIQKINEKVDQISEINLEIEQSVEMIEEGEIQETKDLGKEIKNTLQTKKFTLQTLSNFLDYQVCLINNAIGQSDNLEQFSEQIKNFSENEDVGLDEKNNYIQEAKNKISENLGLIEEINTCFEEDYQRYLSPDLLGVINNDKNLYNSYSEALSSLQDGLSSNNSPVVQSSTATLVELSKKEVVLFQSEEIKNAIQEPTELIKNQASVLDSQEDALEEKLNTLKGDYFLQS